MLNFFDTVVSFLDVIFTFVSNLTEAIVTLIGLLFFITHDSGFLLAAVPGVIGSSILCVTAIAAVKLIAGRQ